MGPLWRRTRHGRPHRWPLVFSGIAIVYSVLSLWHGEIIPVNGGLGYDGERWAVPAQRLAREGTIDQVDAYTFQKSLVWFILGGSYWGLAHLVPPFAQATKEFNPTVALVSFWIVNMVCLAGTAFLWRAILGELNVREPVVLLSFVLLFVSVCNLKMPSYYVAIGDVQMTLWGALFLYLFLKSRQLSLMPVGVLGGFVRSGLPQAAAILTLFPRRDLVQRAGSPAVGVAAAAIASAGVVAACVWHYDRLIEETLAPTWFCLSVLVLGSYVGGAVYILLRDLRVADLRPRLADLWKAALILAAVTLVLALVAGPSSLPLYDFILVTLQTGTYLPAVSLLALVVYFGPGVLLGILLFPRVADAASNFGPGLLILLSLGVCLSIYSEARAVVVFVPAFFAVLAVVLSDMRDLPRWGYYATAALCVLFSKVWLPMAGSAPYSDTFSRFPEQLYFMNFGPYMTVQTFAWQAVAALVATLILGWWLFLGGYLLRRA